MTQRIKGAFPGCPHHGDDYEACIQHSGTAPCGVEEELDRVKAEVKRARIFAGENLPASCGLTIVSMLENAMREGAR